MMRSRTPPQIPMDAMPRTHPTERVLPSLPAPQYLCYRQSTLRWAGRPSDINSLVFESDLRSILTDLNGHWDRLEDWMWQPAYTPAPDQPSQTLTSPAQYSNGLHIDGRRAIGGPGAIYCDAAQTMSIKPFQARLQRPTSLLFHTNACRLSDARHKCHPT